MTPQFSGNQGPVLIDRQYRTAPSGDETVSVFEGSEAVIVASIPAFRTEGYEKISTQANGVYTRAICTAPSLLDGSEVKEQVTTTWALDSNDEQLSMWEHPKIVAAIAAMQTDEARIEFRTNFDNAVQNGTPPGQVPFAAIPDLLEFYLHWMRDIRYFTISTFVLRKQQSVPRNSSVRPSYSNRDRWFSSATLASSEVLDLPILETIFTELAGGFWQKKTPDLTQQSNGRYLITSEWWYADQFSEWQYGAAI